MEDVYIQKRRLWVRLHEKGGKLHQMPCNHNLEEHLQAYLAGTGIAEHAKGYLFRSSVGRSGKLSSNPMGRVDVYRMIRRRVRAAGIDTAAGCHTFRATDSRPRMAQVGQNRPPSWSQARFYTGRSPR